MNKRGEQPKETREILQEMTRERIMPMTRPRIASSSTAIVSVVRPLSLVISSERILESTPGALSLESNHDSYLCKISVKSCFLNCRVKFSPTNTNRYF